LHSCTPSSRTVWSGFGGFVFVPGKSAAAVLGQLAPPVPQLVTCADVRPVVRPPDPLDGDLVAGRALAPIAAWGVDAARVVGSVPVVRVYAGREGHCALVHICGAACARGEGGESVKGRAHQAAMTVCVRHTDGNSIDQNETSMDMDFSSLEGIQTRARTGISW
jgi:hypothetical protein